MTGPAYRRALAQMPRTLSKPGTWDHDLRRQLRREHGAGWTVVEQSGKVKLTYRYAEGTRSSVMLDIPWAATSATAIANEIGVIKARMDEHSISLREAHARGKAVAGVVTGTGITAGAVDWSAIAEQFLATKQGNRKATLKDTTARVNNALQTLQGKPAPTDGASLMRAYAKQHFERCPAGGEGRKRHLGDVAALLIYGVERCGAPGRWMPLKGEALAELIGTDDRSAEDALTPPIKPEQLAALLDALQADGKQQLWLAVALVGCFGLRPAELAVLSVSEGSLMVGSVKRNKRSMKQGPAKPRLALALELPGRDDGARSLQLYASGLVKLPRQIATQVSAGDFKKTGGRFARLLNEVPYWQSLKAATPGLTPYSLRHGYAWRAHKGYSRPLSVRDAAALMGHTPLTHQKHYGRWTDEQGLRDAVAGLMAGNQAPPSVVASAAC